jgi:hypothetical protein
MQIQHTPLASIPLFFRLRGEALTYVSASLSASEEPGVIGKVASWWLAEVHLERDFCGLWDAILPPESAQSS